MASITKALINDLEKCGWITPTEATQLRREIFRDKVTILVIIFTIVLSLGALNHV